MKKLTVVLPVGLAIAMGFLAGCSKSGEAKSGSGAGKGGGPVELKAKWEVGKRYVQRMELNQDAEMVVPTQGPMKQEMTMIQDYAVSVLKELPDGGKSLELEIQGQKIESKLSGKVMMSFDSNDSASKDDNNPIAPMLRKIVGAKLQFEIDAAGKVTAVQGYDAFIARLGSGGRPELMMTIKGMYNEDAFKQLVETGKALPDHPVNFGDSWPVTMEIKSVPGNVMKLSLNCTLKDAEDHLDHKCVRIDSTGELSSTAVPGDSSMKLEVQKGHLSGQTWFDPQLGTVVHAVSDQKMVLGMEFQNQKMTNSVSQKISVKLLELEKL